jgi:putative glycosyltransferase (TIGR04372 family)
MSFRKLQSGLLLIWYYLLGSVRRLGQAFSQGPLPAGHEFLRFTWRTVSAVRVIPRVMRGRMESHGLVRMCQDVQSDPELLYRHSAYAYFLVQPLLATQEYDRIIEILTPLLEPTPECGKCYGVRGMAYLQRGQYREALEDLTRCHQLAPRKSRERGFNQQRAFLHGLRGEVEIVREAMRDQFNLPRKQSAGAAVAEFLHQRVSGLLANLDLRGSVGIFFAAYPDAVGHAILDPFHYINLFAHRFDTLVMVHPDLKGYSAATRQTMSVLEQYVETVVSDDFEALSFAWQYLGELQHKNYTFLLYNYWSLNRLACKARQDPAHPLHRGRTYLQPPPKMVARAETLLRRNHVRLSGPLVVVHTREHGYHGLDGQSYRNTDVRNYIPALRKVLSLGYQVVRVGDRKMTSLRKDVPELLELPMTDFYSPVLDPYVISRCEFMISCQSGPCSYARVFGKPNLVLNAVYHYTLLPEHHELIAFKNYRGPGQEMLSVEQIFQAGAHRFDRTRHFAEHGIEVIDMTAEEIEMALCEMLEWLQEPESVETPAQREFRRLMNHFTHPPRPDSPMATPMADYIGYALPECRISDAVAGLRPGYLDPGPAAESRPRAEVRAA